VRLVWTKPASLDRKEIREYIAQDNPAAALAFDELISEKALRLIDHPGPSSLSGLTLIYCGKVDFGHFLYSFSLNRTTIRLKRAQKLPQNSLSLATIG
jgi:hypothetical protein